MNSTAVPVFPLDSKQVTPPAISITEEMHKPHGYRIIDSRTHTIGPAPAESKSNPICFFVNGCWGKPGADQKAVAHLMNAVAKKFKDKNIPVLFVKNLGDHFYPHGVESPLDPKFKTDYYDIFHDAKTVPDIAGLPHFGNLGNHCYGKKHPVAGEFKSVAAQIAHTYVDFISGKLDFFRERIKLFQGNIIDLAVAPQWIMPSRYYWCEMANILFIDADGNTLAKDYAASLTSDNANNQVHMIKEQVEKHPKATIAFFIHQPLIPKGKRAVAHWDDAKNYIDEATKTILAKEEIRGHHGTILLQIMQRIGLDPKKRDVRIFAAHEHATEIFFDPAQGIFQVIAGGGGGDLQTRLCLEQDENLLFFAGLNSGGAGFISVTILNPASEQPEFIIDAWFTNGIHLQASDRDPIVCRSALPEEENVVRLRECILTARAFFIKKLKQNFNPSVERTLTEHGAAVMQGKVTELVQSDLVRNFFLHYDPRTIEECGAFLKVQFKDSFFNWSSGQDSFVSFINKELARYGWNIKELLKAIEDKAPIKFILRAVRLSSPSAVNGEQKSPAQVISSLSSSFPAAKAPTASPVSPFAAATPTTPLSLTPIGSSPTVSPVSISLSRAANDSRASSPASANTEKATILLNPDNQQATIWATLFANPVASHAQPPESPATVIQHRSSSPSPAASGSSTQ